LLDGPDRSTSPVHAEGTARRRAITWSRTERQFAVEASAIDRVSAAIGERLPCTLGANGGIPITTAYFDDPERTHLEAGLGSGPSDRLRLREYPASSDGGERAYWLERKHHLGPITEKVRRRVPPAEAAALLANRRWAAGAFASLGRGLAVAPLEPVLVVQYLRQTFANDDCRVTLDRVVTFFAPPGAVALPLSERPGQPVCTEAGATLEVKFTGFGPAWMAGLCERLVAQPASKFVRGCRAVATTLQHLTT
jgi:hypothetical protein